jgi:protein-tyrosine phosphatase
MIDFHTHILHDIDDGPASLAETLTMVRIAIADGITTMVATPHGPGSRHGERYTVEMVHARLHALQAEIKRLAWPIEILPGSELHYHPRLAVQLQKGLVLPCGHNQVVLLECPLSHLPSGLEQTIFDMQVAGYRVVLAHPERIRPVQEKPDLLIPLIERGVLMQLTGRALTGEQSPTMQKTAETLLKHRMIHLLASDSHDSTARRSPRLSTACQRAAELLDPETASALVQQIPAALLGGKPIHPPEPQPVASWRRWFGL